jgi:hypothetical protein
MHTSPRMSETVTVSRLTFLSPRGLMTLQAVEMHGCLLNLSLAMETLRRGSLCGRQILCKSIVHFYNYTVTVFSAWRGSIRYCGRQSWELRHRHMQTTENYKKLHTLYNVHEVCQRCIQYNFVHGECATITRQERRYLPF